GRRCPRPAQRRSPLLRRPRHDKRAGAALRLCRPAMSAPTPRYFEDYVEGTVLEAGPITVTGAGIIEFARRYDPQERPVDPVAAAHGRFGGLIASGWHTAALMMRMFASNFLSPASSVASPGIDELRWLLPVRPGDRLSLRVTVLGARRSHSRPGEGIVR